WIYVMVKTLPMPRMLLRPERGRDRFGKAVFLNREVQSGDPAFDDRIYIETDEPAETVRRALESVKVREAIGALLPKVGAFGFAREGIKVAYRSARVNDALIRGAVQALAKVGDVLPNLEGAAFNDSPKNRGDSLVPILWWGFMGMYVFYIILSVVHPDMWS